MTTNSQFNVEVFYLNKKTKTQIDTPTILTFEVSEFKNQEAKNLIDRIKKNLKKKEMVLIQNEIQIHDRDILNVSAKQTLVAHLNTTKLEIEFDFPNIKQKKSKTIKFPSNFIVFIDLQIQAVKLLIAKKYRLNPATILLYKDEQMLTDDFKISSLTGKKKALTARFNNSTFPVRVNFIHNKTEIPIVSPFKLGDVRAILSYLYSIPYDQIQLKDNAANWEKRVTFVHKPNENSSKQSSTNSIEKKEVKFINPGKGELTLCLNTNLTFYQVAVFIFDYFQCCSTQINFYEKGKAIDKEKTIKEYLKHDSITFNIGIKSTLYVYSEIDKKIHHANIFTSDNVWTVMKCVIGETFLSKNSNYGIWYNKAFLKVTDSVSSLPCGSYFDKPITYISLKKLPEPRYTVQLITLKGNSILRSCPDRNTSLGEIIWKQYPRDYNFITAKDESKNQISVEEPVSSIKTIVYLEGNKDQAWYFFTYNKQRFIATNINPKKPIKDIIKQDIVPMIAHTLSVPIQLKYHNTVLDENDTFGFKSQKWDDSIIIEKKVEPPTRTIKYDRQEYKIPFNRDDTVRALKEKFIKTLNVQCSIDNIIFFINSPEAPLSDDAKNPPELINATMKESTYICKYILHNEIFKKEILLAVNDNIEARIVRANQLTDYIIETRNDKIVLVKFKKPVKDISFDFPHNKITIQDANTKTIIDSIHSAGIFFSKECQSFVSFKLWDIEIPLDQPCLNGVPQNKYVNVDIKTNFVIILYLNYTFYLKENETVETAQNLISESMAAFIGKHIKPKHVTISSNKNQLKPDFRLCSSDHYEVSIFCNFTFHCLDDPQSQENLRLDFGTKIKEAKNALAIYKSHDSVQLSNKDVLIYNEKKAEITDGNALLNSCKQLFFKIIEKVSIHLEIIQKLNPKQTVSKTISIDASKTIADLLVSVHPQSLGIKEPIIAAFDSIPSSQYLYENHTTIANAVQNHGNTIYIFNQAMLVKSPVGLPEGNDDFPELIEEEEEENDSNDFSSISFATPVQETAYLTQTIDFSRSGFRKLSRKKFLFWSNLSNKTYKVALYEGETVRDMKEKIANSFNCNPSKLSVYDSTTNTPLDDLMELQFKQVQNMQLFVYVHSHSSTVDNGADDSDVQQYEYEYD